MTSPKTPSQSRWRKFTPDPLTLVSAILIVLAFPPWNLSFLIWIALVPWFIALQRANSRLQVFMQGLWLSMFMSWGGFYWVASVLREFAGLPWAVSVIGLLLFSLIGQPQFYLFAPLFRLMNDRAPKTASVFTPGASGLPLAVGLALAYSGIDWILPKLFVDTLGHAFYEAPRLRQVADLGGATLLTFLVFLVNFGLWNLYQRIRTRTEPSIRPAFKTALPVLALSLALCVLAYGYGWKRNAEIHEIMAHPIAEVQGAVIQANIGDFEKIAAEKGIRGAGENVLNTYITLSDQALSQDPKPDFLVWPETAYPSTFRTPNTSDELARDQRVEGFVRNRKVPLLFGGYDRFAKKDYNALFILSPESEIAGQPALNRFELTSTENPMGSNYGRDLQIYRKNILLLFGEFIPGADTFTFIKKAFPQVGNFGRGIGPDVLSVPLRVARNGLKSILTGPVICYEALFSNYVIEAARKGSQLILNITNDSWFGPHGEPELHLALVTFRSVETRLPQLRATNTGISTLVMPDGEITQPTAIGKAEILSTRIPILSPVPTLMKAWGDWFGAFALGVSVVLLFIPAILPRSKRV